MKYLKLSLLLLPILGLSSCSFAKDESEPSVHVYQMPEATVENYQKGWNDMKSHIIDKGSGILTLNESTTLTYNRPGLENLGYINVDFLDSEYSIHTTFLETKDVDKLSEINFTLKQNGVACSTYTAVTVDMNYVSLKDITVAPENQNDNVISVTEIQGRLLSIKLIKEITNIIKSNDLYPLYW